MRLEDMELLRKENQELKDKVLALQPQKLLQIQHPAPGSAPGYNQHLEGEVSIQERYKTACLHQMFLKSCVTVNIY